MDLLNLSEGISNDRVRSPRFIDLEDTNIVSLDLIGSSKGNQKKWYNVATDEFIKQQLIYQDICWRDYCVEILASDICKASGIDGIVEQSGVELSNGYMGCISKNFCEKGQKFIPIRKLVDEEEVLSKFGWADKSIRFFMDVAYKFGVDWNQYLSKMIIFDYLLANEDRHLNNFGFLYDGTNFRVAPLFDFGIGLFEHDKRYHNKTLHQRIVMIHGKPFADSLEAAVNALLRTDNYDYCKELIKCLQIDFYSPNIPSVAAKEYLEVAYEYLRKKVSL